MGSIVSRVKPRKLSETKLETIYRLCAGSFLPIAPRLTKENGGKFTIEDTIGGFIYSGLDCMPTWEVGYADEKGIILHGAGYSCGADPDHRVAFQQMAMAMVALWLKVVDRRTEEFSNGKTPRGRNGGRKPKASDEFDEQFAEHAVEVF